VHDRMRKQPPSATTPQSWCRDRRNRPTAWSIRCRERPDASVMLVDRRRAPDRRKHERCRLRRHLPIARCCISAVSDAHATTMELGCACIHHLKATASGVRDAERSKPGGHWSRLLIRRRGFQRPWPLPCGSRRPTCNSRPGSHTTCLRAHRCVRSALCQLPA
jgi:hypothetical protein